MPIINTHEFTETIIQADKLLKCTGNEYKVVSARPYVDKKGVLPDGYTLTLKILHDTLDYGFDNEGKRRENNVEQNFDVTVLSRHTPLRKGDYVALKDFDVEHSFAIGFDLILRFKNYQKLDTTKIEGVNK